MSDYTPTLWVPGAAPGISAANLNKLEAGVDTAHDEIADVVADLNAHDGTGGATHPLADGATPGFMSGAQYTKLAGIEPGATADPLGVELVQVGFAEDLTDWVIGAHPFVTVVVSDNFVKPSAWNTYNLQVVFGANVSGEAEGVTLYWRAHIAGQDGSIHSGAFYRPVGQSFENRVLGTVFARSGLSGGTSAMSFRLGAGVASTATCRAAWLAWTAVRAT